eukprot:TRINITY_DN1336_c0_g1_i3.p1 TRINITY_DN1336_c0_g1~~TRINITY_DN1336_c0_g1_i3.p1  ORF type:complete len:1101 (+),score=389.86 TRINITY_DN1336_c0_g1_i3:1657-4959(+)
MIRHGNTYRAVLEDPRDTVPSTPLSPTVITSQPALDELMKTVSDRVRGRADVIDGEKCKRAAEDYAGLGGTIPSVKEEMREFAERLIRWYKAKPGDVVDEIVENLRVPEGSDAIHRLGIIANVLRQEPRVARSFRDLCLAELLAVRGYTQKPIDIDRDVGWVDAPLPQASNESSTATLAREQYEKRFSDWGWAEQRDGVRCRNGSLFGIVCSAMRDQGPGGSKQQWSEDALKKWVKWLFTLAACCADVDTEVAEVWRGLGGGGLPGFVVDNHRTMKEGDALGWPAPSSTSHDFRASYEYMWGTAANSTGRPNTERPGTCMFRMSSVLTGRELVDISQYPAEAELLLGPFTIFRIDSVEEEQSNSFMNADGRPQGLNISMTCLGPMGGPLRQTPWLADFYRSVRRDARRASERLRAESPLKAATVASHEETEAAEAEAERREAALTSELQRTTDELERAQRGIEELQRTLDGERANAGESRELSGRLEEELDACQRRERELREQLAEAAAAAASSCEELSRVNHERSGLFNEHSAAIQERDAAKQAVAELQRELDDAAKARDKQNAELHKLRDVAARCDVMEAEQRRLKDERAAFIARQQELDGQLAEESSQRRIENTERRRAEHAQRRAEGLVEQIRETSSADRSRLEHALEMEQQRQQTCAEQLRAEEKRSDELRSALRRLEKEVERSSREATTLQGTLEEERRAAAAREEQVRADAVAERKRLRDRSEQEDAARRELQASAEKTAAALRADLAQAQQRADASRSECAKLSQQTQQMKHEAERSAKHVSSLEDRVACLVARYEEEERVWTDKVHALRAEVGKQEDRLKEADAAASDLRLEQEHLRQALAAARKEADEQDAGRVRSERAARAEVRDKGRQLAAAVDELEAAKWKHQQQLQDLETKAQRREQQLQTQAADENRRLQRELDDLQRRLRRQTENTSAAENDLRRVSAERDRLIEGQGKERVRKDDEAAFLRRRLEEEVGRTGGVDEVMWRTRQEQANTALQLSAAKRDAERLRAEAADERRRRCASDAATRAVEEELAAARASSHRHCHRCGALSPPPMSTGAAAATAAGPSNGNRPSVSPRRAHSPRDPRAY